jgi:hypothetical protein
MERLDSDGNVPASRAAWRPPVVFSFDKTAPGCEIVAQLLTVTKNRKYLS